MFALGPILSDEAAMTALLKPKLYDAEGTAAAPGHPALIGGRCGACGYTFFPFQAFGCERCGSVDLAPHRLSGTGRLTARARVHLHAGKGREAPFTIVEVKLDDGPTVRTLAAGDAPLSTGQRMATMLAPVTDAAGDARLDLRFTAEG
jgi:uncharacterized OB-fold protein